MGKLYEILAVEGDLEGRAKKLIAETSSTLKNKENLFKGKVRTLKMFDQTPEKILEIQAIEAKDGTEIKLSTTVPDTMNYMACILADYYDVVFQKEASNQIAKGDIIIDDVTLMKDVPITFLLSMENRLKDLRQVISEIPTLAPGKMWTPDGNYGLPNVYRTPTEYNLKTSKEMEYRTVAPATDRHPAQVVPGEITKNIGQYSETEWSGLISSADKAMLLDRTDKLLRAIKKARQRANACEAVSTTVGDDLMRFVFKGWFDRSKMNTEAKV